MEIRLGKQLLAVRRRKNKAIKERRWEDACNCREKEVELMSKLGMKIHNKNTHTKFIPNLVEKYGIYAYKTFYAFFNQPPSGHRIDINSLKK